MALADLQLATKLAHNGAMSVSSLRRNLYRTARLLGDVQAAQRGPAAYAKRVVRKSVYRQSGRLGRAISRALKVN
jgi:hypothetical protein